MQLFKVVFDFINFGYPKFGDKVRYIVTCLTTEPMLTLVPEPTSADRPSRAKIQGALADYETAADAAKDSKAAKKDRDKKRAILESYLKKFAQVVEAAAENANDLTIIEKSGYTLRKPIVKSLIANGVPAAPIILVKRGKTSGSTILSVKPMVPHVASWEAEYALGDPTVEANFTGRVSSASGARITFTGLQTAKLHQFRARGLGTKGPGDWSDPVSFIVT